MRARNLEFTMISWVQIIRPTNKKFSTRHDLICNYLMQLSHLTLLCITGFCTDLPPKKSKATAAAQLGSFTLNHSPKDLPASRTSPWPHWLARQNSHLHHNPHPRPSAAQMALDPLLHRRPDPNGRGYGHDCLPAIIVPLLHCR